MTHYLFAGAFVVLLSLNPLAAHTEIERTMAEDLLTLTDVEGNLTAMREQFTKMIEAQLSTMQVPDKLKERMTQHQEQLIELAFEELSWRRLKDQYVEVYVSVFTQEELAALITFYRSPVGQAFIKKTPELMRRMMEIGQSRMQQLQPRIMGMVEDLMSEIDAEAEAEVQREGIPEQR